jgi:superfamily II DNA or RNA helicase
MAEGNDMWNVNDTDIDGAISLLAHATAGADFEHESPSVKEIPLLTSESPRKPTAHRYPIELWPHQEAIIARCNAIEQSPNAVQTQVQNTARYQDKSSLPSTHTVNVGVINDPPGAGKTYSILALIEQNPIGTNIIIVPQNILQQWDTAMKTLYANTKLKYGTIKNYADIMYLTTKGQWDEPPKFLEYDVLILEASYAETLSAILSTPLNPGEKPPSIARLIIDEVDSIQDLIKTPINAQFVWLVSASFEHTNGKVYIGPYFFDDDLIPHIFCKCDPAFVAKSIQLPEPVVRTVNCKSAEAALFAGVASLEAMIGLHTDDRRPLIKEMGRSFPPGIYSHLDLAKQYLIGLERQVEILKDVLEITKEKSDFIFDAGVQTAEDKQFSELSEKLERLKNNIAAYVPTPQEETKQHALKQLYKEIKAGGKWLFFNDNASALYDTQAAMERAGIDSVMLDGGSPSKIARCIEQYKTGSKNVLLLNSKLEGAGMNLENTSHLVFMHATEPRLVEQVMGRAQRHGRTAPLTVIHLLNESENTI